MPVRGRVFTIDGADIVDLSTFLCAMGEAVNGPGGYFGWRWLSFYDCLFGGFGLEMPCQIVWRNAAASKQKMDSAMLAGWCAEEIAEIDRSADREAFEEGRAGLAATLDLARRGERAFFDDLVALIEGIRTHELSRLGGIELILDLGERA